MRIRVTILYVSSAIFRLVRVKSFFPPGDPLAAKVARLCILREDFLIETQGVLAETIKELDEHSSEFRRVYFLRKLTITLNELYSAINALLCDPEFKALFEKQPAENREPFTNIGRRMAHGRPATKEVRDAICAHVSQTAVQEALERIDPEEFGFFEIGPRANKTHMKFIHPLVAEIMLSGVSRQERANLEASKVERIASLFFLFALTEDILLMYAKDRGFLKR